MSIDIMFVKSYLDKVKKFNRKCKKQAVLAIIPIIISTDNYWCMVLSNFFLVTHFAKAFFAFMSSHFMTFSFFAAGHTLIPFR